MKQILYASVATAFNGKSAQIAAIVEESRHNNALDGITGLLWTDGERFLQVIEGGDDAVDACYARICADGRHCAIVTIIERTIEKREFGYWAMAHKTRDMMADAHDERIRRMMTDAADDISAPFLDLVSVRRAA